MPSMTMEHPQRKVWPQDRYGRVRGRRAGRLADQVEAALRASADPFEVDALRALLIRTDHLARRAQGLRGWGT